MNVLRIAGSLGSGKSCTPVGHIKGTLADAPTVWRG